MSWKNILKEDKENPMGNPQVREGYNKARDKDIINPTHKLKRKTESYLPLISWAKEKDLRKDELGIEQTIDKILDLDDSKYDEAKSLFDSISEPLQRLKKKWHQEQPPLW